MEGAIKTMVMQFLNAARGKDNLDKKSFQKLLNTHLGNVLTNTKDSTAVGRLMNRMDDNDDGKVSFQEYLTLIGGVAKAFSDSRTGAQNSATN
ncbi:protein S100-A11 [Trichomycterus rosablanca]|uniref:protein S100-A11 n=1 Tax=Trichomycterus rosablanca TaxID=2290929 RepID=UPI002F35C33A